MEISRNAFISQENCSYTFQQVIGVQLLWSVRISTRTPDHYIHHSSLASICTSETFYTDHADCTDVTYGSYITLLQSHQSLPF